MTKYQHQDRDDPYNVVASVTLAPSEQGEVTIEPSDRTSDYYLAVLAVSKHPSSTYKVETDSTGTYGPYGIPPTDIDDGMATFVPPEVFTEEVLVTIENLGSTKTRTYYVQAIGWERRRRSTEGGL